MFLTKLRSTYEPADAVFQLRAKWQTLRIGCDTSDALFNEKFAAVRLKLNPYDPQTDQQLLYAYQAKLTGNRTAATALAVTGVC